MLSLATSSPASTRAVICSGPEVAGPRVHTIFARRLMAGAPSPVAAGAFPRRRAHQGQRHVIRPVVYTIMRRWRPKVTLLTEPSSGVHPPETLATDQAGGRAQVMGRMVGAMGTGSAEEPIRYPSTAAAALRPS